MKPRLSDDAIFQERFNAVVMFCIAMFYGYAAYGFWGEGYANWWYELLIPSAVRNSAHAIVIIANGVAITLFPGWLILYFSVTGQNFFIRRYRVSNYFCILYGTLAFLLATNGSLILPIYLISLIHKLGISAWLMVPIGAALYTFMIFCIFKLLPRLASVLGVKIVENRNQEK